MKLSPGWCRAITVITGLAFTPAVTATTGYWGIGYGAKAMGMAGAVVSNPQDSIVASTNPAGMALVGERFDVGMRFFTPQREATLETSALGANFDVDDESRNDLFKIPNFGYTSQINDQLWWGISVYGNGGNVDYLSHWTYSYPDPIQIGLCADELFCMAGGAARGDQRHQDEVG